MSRIGHIDEFPVNETTSIQVDYLELLVVNRNGELFLYENKCPHVNDSLDPMGGSVARAAAQMVFCQRHGAEFLSDTGECVSGACLGQFLNVIPFTLSNGDIYLD
jgi:nitrite reductase/ring-hydroxylating ferredoxin subunit